MNRAARSAGKRVAKKAAKTVVKGLALKVGGTVGFWIAVVLALLLLVIAAAGGSQQSTSPTAPGNTISQPGAAGQVTAPPGADVTLVHAAQIANVAYGRGLGRSAAITGIDVAIAESNLYNYANDGTSTQSGTFTDGHRQLNDAQRAVARESLNYPHDDKVGRDLDSMGLFQQRPSASWGTPAQLMDPAVSAGKFYDALVKVDGWQTMTPAAAAQKVQGSNDPTGGIYARVYDQAVQVVDQLGAPTGATGSGSAVAPVPVNGVQVPIPAGAGVTGTINAPTPTVAKAIAAGLAWIGEAYSWNGGNDQGPTLGICGPDGAENDCHIVGFDCSGLMSYMWAQVGIHVESYTQNLWDASVQVPWVQKVPGDMIGYGGAGSNHIAMYVGTWGGVDMMLEAPYSGAFVRIAKVRDGHHAGVYRLWQGK